MSDYYYKGISAWPSGASDTSGSYYQIMWDNSTSPQTSYGGTIWTTTSNNNDSFPIPVPFPATPRVTSQVKIPNFVFKDSDPVVDANIRDGLPECYGKNINSLSTQTLVTAREKARILPRGYREGITEILSARGYRI
jgi:hypothetical protein